MNIPGTLKYSEDHEWIKVDGDTAIIGITAHAQNELGDIVFVEVETVGETLEANDKFGTIEAVKTVSDLFLPVNGEVIDFNEDLDTEPELVNSDPYGKGWIIKIKMSNPAEVNDLLDAEAYKKFIGA